MAFISSIHINSLYQIPILPAKKIGRVVFRRISEDVTDVTFQLELLKLPGHLDHPGMGWDS